MGSNWHKREEKNKREWVVYLAAAVVLLIVAGAITLGVVLGNKKDSGGEQAATQAIAGSAASNLQPATQLTSPPPAAVLSPPPPPRSSPPPSIRSSPPPAAVPVPAPSPPAPSPPTLVSPPPALVSSPPPPPAITTPTTPTTSGESTFDPSFIARGTLTGPPDGLTSPSYDPRPVPAGMEGTCSFQRNKEFRCNDDMDFGSTNTVPIEQLQLMGDPQMMESCGFAELEQIVNPLVKWAYKGKCGIRAFTTGRACVGIPGVADGYWRARVMLWPVEGGDPSVCVPLCIKMRGFQNTVTDYGRTGGC